MTDILVFGAHPDDAEFGMGASILKFVAQGKSVAVCVLTRGESGTMGTSEERMAETRDAAEAMGVALNVLGLVDCRVFDTYENRVSLARVIREHRPRVIFAPYHTNSGYHRDGAAHPDHVAAGVLARNAARYARFKGIDELNAEPWSADHIVYYILPRHMKPDLLIDVTEHMLDWDRVVHCHRSQTKLRDGEVIPYLRKLREAWGLPAGVPFAEAFAVEEPILFDIDLFLKP